MHREIPKTRSKAKDAVWCMTGAVLSFLPSTVRNVDPSPARDFLPKLVAGNAQMLAVGNHKRCAPGACDQSMLHVSVSKTPRRVPS